MPRDGITTARAAPRAARSPLSVQEPLGAAFVSRAVILVYTADAGGDAPRSVRRPAAGHATHPRRAGAAAWGRLPRRLAWGVP